MFRKIFVLIEKFWGNYFPKRQILLKTGSQTKFFNLSSSTQVTFIFAIIILISWSVFSLLIFSVTALNLGTVEAQFQRERLVYDNQISKIAEENHRYSKKFVNSEKKLEAALDAIEYFQYEMTKAQLREEELQAGLKLLQELTKQRKSKKFFLQVEPQEESFNEELSVNNQNTTNEINQVSVLMSLLEETIRERDESRSRLSKSLKKIEQISHQLDLSKQSNEQIFRQIEEALIVSVKPLEKMFRSVGLDLESILSVIRNSYSGYGGPNLPISNLPEENLTHNEQIAKKMIDKILELSSWRIAVQKLPFAHPLNENFRYTSGFGPRWGTIHNGTDMAARHGSPILATADGVISFAGWEKGYGKLVKIRHDFGYETRYAHLSKFSVNVGQRVSQGKRIGEMGNTGRSTGTHLHYEIRRNGKPTNPMKYIRAKQNVF